MEGCFLPAPEPCHTVPVEAGSYHALLAPGPSMGRPLRKLQQFFRELKRRNVYEVAATYAVVGVLSLGVGPAAV